MDDVGKDTAELREMDSMDVWFDSSFDNAVKALKMVQAEVPENRDERTIITRNEAENVRKRDYSGDGMPSARLAAKALSGALLDSEKSTNHTWPAWFPISWVVSEERMSKEITNSTQAARKVKHGRSIF